MYESNEQTLDNTSSTPELCGVTVCKSRAGSESTHGNDTHGKRSGRALVERLSRYRMQVSGAWARTLQRQDASDNVGSGQHGLSPGTAERASITPAMRKKYLKELLLSNSSRSGLGSVLSSETYQGSVRDETDAPGTDWALYPMEHAWMLTAVDGNYDTIMEYITEDPNLLTRKDFVSGYTVLHWLAKKGHDEVLVKLLRYAEGAGIPVNVNLKGSGGLTPLHVATMHCQYMVIKHLVGAFGADVDAMDYNGRRACQYLKGNAPLEMKELLGNDEYSCVGAENVNNSAGGVPLACEEEGGSDEDTNYFDRTRNGSWRFGSFRKMFSQFSFGNRS